MCIALAPKYKVLLSKPDKKFIKIMDRFVVREFRGRGDYPQGNQAISFRANAPISNTNMVPTETMYFGGYAAEYPTLRHEPMSPQNFQMTHGYMSEQSSPATYPSHSHPQTSAMSGIDPRYLSAYSDSNAAYIVTGQHAPEDMNRMSVTNINSDYESRRFVAPDRSKRSAFTPQMSKDQPKPHKIDSQSSSFNVHTPVPRNSHPRECRGSGPETQGTASMVSFYKTINESKHKDEVEIPTLTRADKLKALHKSGTRVFSGPVEKIQKWHKSLQEIGILVIYEIFAKCVNVRPGDSCSKVLVVRDDNGPAMQVVYYEVDFLLPELKPPCTVRVVGRMMPGTCRLQAFNVRLATGDDVATLPRRAAVAAHHVAKLCKDYGVQF